MPKSGDGRDCRHGPAVSHGKDASAGIFQTTPPSSPVRSNSFTWQGRERSEYSGRTCPQGYIDIPAERRLSHSSWLRREPLDLGRIGVPLVPFIAAAMVRRVPIFLRHNTRIFMRSPALSFTFSCFQEPQTQPAGLDRYRSDVKEIQVIHDTPKQYSRKEQLVDTSQTSLLTGPRKPRNQAR